MRSTPLLVCVLLVIAPFFFLGGPAYHAPRSLKAGWDLGHVFFFFVVTILLCRAVSLKRPGWSRKKGCLALFLGVLVLGVMVELLQLTYSGRAPDLYDILRNQLGCLLGMVFIAGRPADYAALKRNRLLLTGVLGGGLVAMQPLLSGLVDEQVARNQFPVLSDFETPFEERRWNNPRQLTIQEEIVRHGSKAAKVQLSTAEYSGVSLFYFPHDWSGYRTMQVSFYNPLEEELTLHCRIHDVNHRVHGMAFADRYHNKFVLQPGWNDLAISLDQVKNAPAGRRMDMERIQHVGFFVIRQPLPRIIYLDHLYLSR